MWLLLIPSIHFKPVSAERKGGGGEGVLERSFSHLHWWRWGSWSLGSRGWWYSLLNDRRCFTHWLGLLMNPKSTRLQYVQDHMVLISTAVVGTSKAIISNLNKKLRICCFQPPPHPTTDKFDECDGQNYYL